MNIFPALRFHMGSWDYYVVKMSARELSENVKFATEVYENRTLDDAIQRILMKSRVNKEIVEYLKRQEHRFFSSLVLATLDGDPKFYPVDITEDVQFNILREDSRVKEAFGILRFDGTQQYYALDGQHRLAAIRTLLDPPRNRPGSKDEIPADLLKSLERDELSVIVIVPREDDTVKDSIERYRRLFTYLNRYAKPTDQVTNIIMDEDDALAIVTRRLIAERDFFKWEGEKPKRIKTKKGKNLKTGDSYFTSIETLYEMNIALLNSAKRRAIGWGQGGEQGPKLKDFVRFRPSEDYIDSLHDELLIYWEGILTELPILRSDPIKMRFHERKDWNKYSGTDHLLFWPIGQQMLADIARRLLDERLPDPENPTAETVRSALSGLSELEWGLHHAPWKYFLLVPSTTRGGKRRWIMRSEDRTKTVRLGQGIQEWILGLLEHEGPDYAEILKSQWKGFLILGDPPPSAETIDKLWQQVVEKKSALSS